MRHQVLHPGPREKVDQLFPHALGALGSQVSTERNRNLHENVLLKRAIELISTHYSKFYLGSITPRSKPKDWKLFWKVFDAPKANFGAREA
jgi:hypothetical protein